MGLRNYLGLGWVWIVTQHVSAISEDQVRQLCRPRKSLGSLNHPEGARHRDCAPGAFYLPLPAA